MGCKDFKKEDIKRTVGRTFFFLTRDILTEHWVVDDSRGLLFSFFDFFSVLGCLGGRVVVFLHRDPTDIHKRPELILVLRVLLLLPHVLRRIQEGLVAHRDVAAGIGGVGQRVAVLARGGCGGGTPRDADHVPVAHALALLLATVVEALALVVGRVLEEAALERQADRTEEVGLLGVGVGAEHHGAAIVFGIHTELAPIDRKKMFE